MAAGVREKHPEFELYVVDTKLASIAEGLLAYEAIRQRNRGLSAKQLASWAEEARWYVNSYFTLDELDHLRRGGRIPSAAATIGDKLNIKPMLTVEADGEVNMWGKVRSPKKAIPKLVEKARELTEAFGPIEACLVHVRDLADVTALKRALEESGLPVTITGMMQTGPVITTHVCVGCFGFAYVPMEV